MKRKIFYALTAVLSAMMFSITAAAQQSFSVSLNGRQEVPATTSTAGGDCRITLNVAETQVTVSCNYRDLTSNVVGAHIHDNGPVGVNGPIRFNFNYTGGTSGTIGPLTFDTTPTQVADLRSNKWYVNIHTANFASGEIRGQVKRANVPYDHDGDGRTDIVTHRRSATTIFTLNSLDNSFSADPFGVGAGDNFVNNIPGDFDGDGRADYVMIRVGGGVITWIILQSGSNTYRIERWGGSNDAITPSDYDGDGKLDIATFRRSTGIWYILESSTGNPRYEQWGVTADLPIAGDYDGDGRADLCVMRNEDGLLTWWILNTSTGQSEKIYWGQSSTDSIFFFFQIDVDGDGKQDLMVQRNEAGQHVYYVRRSSDGGQYALTWGLSTFFPLFGDYDGDGKTDFVNRQVLTGGQYRWHIWLSATQSYRAYDFGFSGDQRPGEPGQVPVGSDDLMELR